MQSQSPILLKFESIPSFKFHAGMGIGARLPLDELYQAWVAQGELLLDRHALGIDLNVASINNFVSLHRVLVANGILGGFR
jgi:hypothetical protein